MSLFPEEVSLDESISTLSIDSGRLSVGFYKKNLQIESILEDLCFNQAHHLNALTSIACLLILLLFKTTSHGSLLNWHWSIELFLWLEFLSPVVVKLELVVLVVNKLILNGSIISPISIEHAPVAHEFDDVRLEY